MTESIILEEALQLVDFVEISGKYHVLHVKGDVKGEVRGSVKGDVGGPIDGNVWGTVKGDVWGNVEGSVRGTVKGDVWGSVEGDILVNVQGTISQRQWQFVETPKEKLRRLIKEDADEEQLIKALDQLEDSL